MADAGPAVIEEIESTTVVTPAFDVAVDAELNLVLTRRQPHEGRASDPIFVEVAWSRLIAVVEQEAQALLRTAFTNIVRESGDLSAGVFDLQGRMVAQAITGTPGHINSMALAVPPRAARDAPRPRSCPATCSPPTTRGWPPAT